MRGISDTVKHIIIINVIFWIATLLIGNNGDFMNDLFAMHFPLNDGFKPWQILSHMFMHASYQEGGGVVFYHILFNMMLMFIKKIYFLLYLGRSRLVVTLYRNLIFSIFSCFGYALGCRF